MPPRYSSSSSLMSLGATYEVHDDRLELRTRLHTFVIPYETLRGVAVRPPLVVLDALRTDRGVALPLRTLKLDLADLSEHVALDLSKGFWRQLRITPDDPAGFVEATQRARTAWRDGAR